MSEPTKILNIDELAKTTRTLKYKGVDYQVEDMTVENFIETTKQAKLLKDIPDIDVQLSASVDLVSRFIPTMDRSILNKMSIAHLHSVLEFAQGAFDEKPKVETPSEPGVTVEKK